MTGKRGPTPAPFFCLTRAAWIPYALTWDPESGEFRGVESPRVRHLPRGAQGSLFAESAGPRASYRRLSSFLDHVG